VSLGERKDFPLAPLISPLVQHWPNADVTLVRRAFMFAQEVHAGQTREDGQPYFTHPYEVAMLAARYRMDDVSIASALLHDTMEDAPSSLDVSRETVTRLFGERVGLIVWGLTKLKARFGPDAPRPSPQEELKRILDDTVGTDIRILLIKLLDRSNNMKSLDVFRQEKQFRIAWETTSFYIPLARRLGLFKLSRAMEDQALRYTQPEQHRLLKNELRRRVGEHRAEFHQEVTEIHEALRKEGIWVHSIGITAKNLFELHELLRTEKQEIKDIDQVAAYNLLITVSKTSDCYRALWKLHERFKHNRMQMRDFIGTPKVNGYQALHSVIITPGGRKLQAVIRTPEMEERGWLGLLLNLPLPGEGAPEWLGEIATDAMDADLAGVYQLTAGLMFREINVFTPKGQMFTLPEGSSILDFAYHIHSDIGLRAVGAKIGGKPVLLARSVRNGDQVEIIRDANHEPDPNQLYQMKTQRAQLALRRFFKKKETQSAKQGLDDLNAFLFKLGISPLDKREDAVAQFAGYDTAQTLGRELFYGRVLPEHVLTGIPSIGTAEELERFSQAICADEIISCADIEQMRSLGFGSAEVREMLSNRLKAYIDRRFPVDELIELVGLRHALPIHLTRCCSPGYDNAIKALLTGREAAIHCEDCHNIQAHVELQLYNLVDARWKQPPRFREETLVIAVKDRPLLLRDILVRISGFRINILQATATAGTAGQGEIRLRLLISEIESMDRLIQQLGKVQQVLRVDLVE